MEYVLMPLLFLTSVFLILLILIQRGRGGGLAGAFGGMGGQSAFGTKAGDVFTRVTIVTAAVWIILCAITVSTMGKQTSRFADVDDNTPRKSSSKKPVAAKGAAAPSAADDAATDAAPSESGSAEKGAADSDAPAGGNDADSAKEEK